MIKLSESVGIVETKKFSFAEPPNEFVLESGEKLGPVTLAYETYGKLNKGKDNAVLVLHALSGDAHAAGRHLKSDKKSGWWDWIIGPGRPIDTKKYFVVCSNVIGGCKGSTGPSSTNPETKKPYGLSFPIVTVRDWVLAQKRLLDHLGVEKIFCVIGGSMGGMQVLDWTLEYPDFVESAIPIATCAKVSAQNIAFDEVGRRTIIQDPNFENGDYYGKKPPNTGLALARMMAHITYLSEHSMREKFGRRLREREKYGYDFSVEFEVESYLQHQGNSFIKRFDANSYLYITKAIDYYDLTEGGRKKLVDVFKKIKSKFLVVSFTHDWLYPDYDSKEIVKALKANLVDVTYCNINSTYGHDAFLVEKEKVGPLIRNFLDNVRRKKCRTKRKKTLSTCLS